MACQAMYVWSLSGLVGAFLDLAISYFLLCASAVAFMASKFLGFFGLCLPCPCDGIFFIHPNRNLCFQRLFIEYPTDKVSNVQLSVRSRFPFNDAICGNDPNRNLSLRLVGEKERDVIELEGEASCSSSVSDARSSNNVLRIKGEINRKNAVGEIKLLGMREGRFDMKGKGSMHPKPRSGFRSRRKGSGFDHGRYSSLGVCDPPFGGLQGVSLSPPSISKGKNESVNDDIVYHEDGNEKYHVNYDEDAPTEQKRISNGVELNEILDDAQFREKNASYVKALKGNMEPGISYGTDDKNTIRLLEHALEEEHAARTALYLELEKERSAAATAADEAMAMIQRLQEEKASIEMEGRQYQRILEEKSAYDTEEMNILKEIIVRREREKHFLEKEVEAYQEIINLENDEQMGNGGDAFDIDQQLSDPSLDRNEDPVSILHQLSASIDEKVMIENSISDEVRPIHKKNGALDSWKELSISGWDGHDTSKNQGHPDACLSLFSVCSNYTNKELEDKMVPPDRNSCAPPEDLQIANTLAQTCKPGHSHEKFPENSIPVMGKGKEHSDNGSLHVKNAPPEDLQIADTLAQERKPGHSHEKFPENSIPVMGKGKGHSDNGSLFVKKEEKNVHDPPHDTSSKQHLEDANQGTITSSSSSDKEPFVHDVHIIGSQSNLCNPVNKRKTLRMPIKCPSDIHLENDVSSEPSNSLRFNAISDGQSSAHSDYEVDIKRSSSDMTGRLPPIGPKKNPQVSDTHRNSVSSVDNERLKIDNEIGWLRDRLRIVQEGREILNLSVEHREREKLQLKLLEDIAHQLQEIRQCTEPGKSTRQASLPLPSAKVISKKRRCRSVSLGHQTSF